MRRSFFLLLLCGASFGPLLSPARAEDIPVITVRKSAQQLDLAVTPLGGAEGALATRTLNDDLATAGAFVLSAGGPAAYTARGNAGAGSLQGQLTDRGGAVGVRRADREKGQDRQRPGQSFRTGLDPLAAALPALRHHLSPFKMKTFPCFLAAALLVLAGCGGTRRNNGDAAATGRDSDFVNGTPLPPRQEGVSFLDPSVSKSRFGPVHFGFDSYVVEPVEAGKVRAVAGFLKSGGNGLIVAGFTDERGTPEYNRALGEKRAGAVREALIADGADAGRIQTVSFGEEMPVEAGSNETAWAANRRAEFGVTRQ